VKFYILINNVSKYYIIKQQSLFCISISSELWL